MSPQCDPPAPFRRPPRRPLTIPEAAHYLGITRQAVHAAIAAGRLQRFRARVVVVGVRAADVERLRIEREL